MINSIIRIPFQFRILIAPFIFSLFQVIFVYEKEIDSI